VLGHEGRYTRLQRPDLFRMLKLHGGSFLEGLTIVSYDVFVALPIGLAIDRVGLARWTGTPQTEHEDAARANYATVPRLGVRARCG
jgi:hypothetical protein